MFTKTYGYVNGMLERIQSIPLDKLMQILQICDNIILMFFIINAQGGFFMHISREEALRLARKIENQFNSNHMILFVGQNTSDNLLSDYVLRLPWSCVFTTRRDPDFSSLFISDQRTVKEYSLDNVTTTPLDRNCIPILRLYGVEGQTNESGEEDFLAQLGLSSSENIELNKKYIGLWPKLLEYMNQMFVIGYNSSIPGDIPINDFARGLYHVPDENVTFFDVSEDDTMLISVAKKKHFPYYQDNFSEILSIAPEHSYDISSVPIDSTVSNVYYINGKATAIDDLDLVQTKHFATLLTDKEVYSIRPQGRYQQATYFLNFLNQSSSEGPQWYGYLSNTKYYLEREYYTTLKQLVEIFATTTIKAEYPILLQGNPSSSKSVTLGALAFELFNQHNYPVIFIHDEFLSLTAGSIEFDALNILMSKIQYASTSPIILFWDCSSHRNVLSHAKQLVKDLKNVGRNAVVVCSSYVYSSEKARDQYFYIVKKEKGLQLHETQEVDSIDLSSVIRKADGCYIVSAERKMSEAENRRLRSLFASYSGIPSAHLNKWWKQLNEEAHNDIFDYFYTLISLIRPELQEGLSAEQDIVSKYIRKQLDKIKSSYINEINEKRSFSNSNIFELSGFDLSELGLSSDDIALLSSESDGEDLYDLDKFFTCIALFSQFKLSVPSGFALKLLLKQYSDDFSVFTESGKELFRIITKDIPWIRYGQHGANEDFTFAFRNTREAEIFLDKNDISVDSQMDIVCDLLDYLGRDYRDNGYVDYNVKTSIQQLLRLLGPNTSYIEFKKNGIRQENHKVFIKKLNLVIEKLESLRTVYNVPDDDGTFTNIEVTFVREYYGKREVIYDGKTGPWIENPSDYSLDDFHTRLEKLSSAISLARSVISEIERTIHEISKFDRQYIWDTRNALVNEMVLCNLSAETIVKEYQDWCWDYQISPLDKWKDSSFVLPYSAVFSQMKSVIDSNPANGYYYNTLFKIFEREYARPGLSESRKMQYLMQITQISDSIDGNTSLVITNRGANGRDELSEHILNINNFASKYSIGIDQILSRGDDSNVFLQQYDQLMEVNNPTGILFVCRTEMEKGGLLKVNQKLTDEQIATCEKIMKFMYLGNNYNCIEGNAIALAFLVRVVWMHHTGLPFYSHEEGVTIGLPQKQWRELDNLCSDYYRLTLEHASPRIVLINALARLQTSGSFEECDRILQCIHERNFYSSNRMNTPFIYCDEEGKPYTYTGKVLSTKNTSGFIAVNRLPKYLGGNVGIRFKMYNLGITNVNYMPKKDNVLDKLEIGIGYPGFALYRESGRKFRKEV